MTEKPKAFIYAEQDYTRQESDKLCGKEKDGSKDSRENYWHGRRRWGEWHGWRGRPWHAPWLWDVEYDNDGNPHYYYEGYENKSNWLLPVGVSIMILMIIIFMFLQKRNW